MSMPSPSVEVDITRPQYDLSTYFGRLCTFVGTCSPLLALTLPSKLEEARRIVLEGKAGNLPRNVTQEDWWKAKRIYDSAFHPDTGEKVLLPARMSSQVWANMMILGAALTVYQSTPLLIGVQILNQSFNALVNYYNRNASSPQLTTNERIAAFTTATLSATAVVVGVRRTLARFGSIGWVGRFIPFFAGAAANAVNIPLVRNSELRHGVAVRDENGEVIGTSKIAAKMAVKQTVLSRIVLMTPAACGSPIIMSALERYNVLGVGRCPRRRFVGNVAVCGMLFWVGVPAACALFRQQQPVKLALLEPEVQKAGEARGVTIGYFNKGL